MQRRLQVSIHVNTLFIMPLFPISDPFSLCVDNSVGCSKERAGKETKNKREKGVNDQRRLLAKVADRFSWRRHALLVATSVDRCVGRLKKKTHE